MSRRNWLVRTACIAGLLAIVTAAFLPNTDAQAQRVPRAGRGGGAGGARNPSNNNPANVENNYGISDQQVVNAIKKGVDYLLSIKKGDNWESGRGWTKQHQHGGQTAQALYALLTVGDSVKDDPAFDDDFNAKLSFRSKELAPVVTWLCQQELEETYSNAFAALALSHIDARSPEVQATLDRIDAYMIASMGVDGGYQYANNHKGALADSPLPENIKKVMIARVEAALALSKLRSQMKEARAKPDATLIKSLDAPLRAAEAEYAKADLAVKNEKNPEWFGDISNSQYGAYAMWVLSESGFEAPHGYWTTTDTYWRKHQLPDGGWGYDESKQGLRENMALAGIATLYVTQEFSTLPVVLEPRKDENIERGLAWLNAQFRPKGDDMYYMYGVERIGLASGLKYFNQTNWYMEGAKGAIAAQNADGSWDKSSHAEGETSVATAFALLFLVRGRNPVLFNKLQYDGPWNARPRDNANITDWLNKKLEKEINWQIVNFKVNPEEWMDAPVLLITGSKALTFTTADIEKLRTYINGGGMIFSTADGASPEFTNSVLQIASKIVEENGKAKYEMRELPKDHMLFSQDMWAAIATPPRILSMSNGVREIWVHSTVDMGASWQARKSANKDHFEFPANLFRYASGKSMLRSKLASLQIVTGNAAANKNITLTRVDYPGNWDPEPGAFPRLAKLMKRDAKTDLQIKSSTIAALSPKINPIAHMTGTTGFPVNAGDVASLQKYLADGGTLLVDAAGSSNEFKVSFQKLMQQVYPTNALAPVSLTSPVYNGTIPDSLDMTKVDYRMFYRLTVRGRNTIPMLKGIQVDGRYTVLYSEEDITSGLLGSNTWGILGYTPESSQGLMRNLILYANNPKAGKEGLGVGDAAAAGN